MGCSSSSTASDSSSVTLLNITVSLPAGVTCDSGGVDADFTGQAGKTVDILVSGASSLTPRFTLYAPDFATQLGFSSPNGAGKAFLSIALTQSGAHHLTLCDANGTAGSLKVNVTQRLLGG